MRLCIFESSQEFFEIEALVAYKRYLIIIDIQNKQWKTQLFRIYLPV